MQYVQHPLSQQSPTCCILCIGSLYSHINEQGKKYLLEYPPSWIKVHHVLNLGTYNKLKVSNVISIMNDPTSYYTTTTKHTYNPSKEKAIEPVT